MGTYPSKCTNCGKDFIWFSGNNAGMCQECYKFDTSTYVQIPAISSEYNQRILDAVSEMPKKKAEPLDNLKEAYSLVLRPFHENKHFSAQQHIHKALYDLNAAIQYIEGAK